MEESKAISPEIKGLFETIKKQAAEYSRAFEFFEEEKKAIIRQRRELEDLMNILTEELNQKLQQFERNFTEYVATIEERAQSINEVYQQLESIAELNKSMTNLNSELKVKLLEVDSLLKTLSNRIDSEFENLQNKLNQKFQENLETTLKRMEVKYSLKFKSLDEKVINFEQKILNSTVTFSRFSKSFYDEIDSIKENLQNLKETIYDERQRIEARFSEFMENLNQKLIYFDQIASKADERTETSLQAQIEEQSKLQDQVRILFQQLNDSRLRTNQLESSLKLLRMLLIVSFVILIALIVIL